jgi:hypothetical protein
MILPETSVSAVSDGLTLWADIPPEHTIDQLHAAARFSLDRLGYSITDTSKLYDEPSQISGQTGTMEWIQETVISMRLRPSRTRIEVRVEPYGNDAESRRVMRTMLRTLGYGPSRSTDGADSTYGSSGHSW